MTMKLSKKGSSHCVLALDSLQKTTFLMMQSSQESGTQSVIDFAERSNCLIKALFHPLEL